MRLSLHPAVPADISRIMEYYAEIGGERLALEFYEELHAFFGRAAGAPEGYAVGTRGLRRVNLERFPYHFWFRVQDDCVRVLVVRHHSRKPSLAMGRR